MTGQEELGAQRPEPLPPRPPALTRSESRLGSLCGRTFLSLWSFPGISKDQGPGGALSGSKEVCDLLVVFENHVIIFSDKTCEFPSTRDLVVDWQRWYRRAITQSAKQVRGAERWIREHPDRLFLDRECKHPFPFALPDATSAHFHRIIVAGGAGKRCREEFGGNGSLMVVNTLGQTTSAIPAPFTIGQVDTKSGLIHVLDDFSLSAVLRTVDTIRDFVDYLSAKERLFASANVWAAGEEEMLAHYLKNADDTGHHSFDLPPGIDAAVFDEGIWNEFSRHPQREAQLAADRISYEWDALIEKFTHFATTGTTEFTNCATIDEFQRCIRFMARESRFKRRVLATSLLEIMSKARPGQERATRVMPPQAVDETTYVFLALAQPGRVSDEDYRTVRRRTLENLCLVARSQWPEATDIIGIATEPARVIGRSEDLIYVDGRDWNDSMNDEARRLQREHNLLTNMTKGRRDATEYPLVQKRPKDQPSRDLKVGRNEPCPCGSGRKYKKCCLGA